MLVLALLIPLAATAQDTAARDHFQSGRQAFEAGRFADALGSFEAALSAGMTGPAIHFNIGVAAYRAGRQQRAREAFIETARTPAMAALAHYNLGLVALALDETSEARGWFARAEQEAQGEKLRALASTRLSALAPAPPPRPWMAYAAMSAGYDDNVALTSGAEVLGVSGAGDAFGELQLALSAPIEGPWRWDASMMLVKHADLHLFDQANAAAGGSFRLQSGRWTNELGLGFDHTLLDGEGLENRRVLTLGTRTRLSAGWALRARYRLSDIEGLNEFTGLGGRRQDAAVRLTRAFGAWETGYDLELQSAQYDNPAYSVKRSRLTVDVQRSFPLQWTVGAQATTRISRYDLEENGRETLLELALLASRDLSSRWRLSVRYGFADNDAPRPDFNYSRHRLTFTLEATP